MENCVFPVFEVLKGAYLSQTLTQIDDTRTCSVVRWNKVICNISPQYVKACRRKVRKTAHYLYSKFIKRHNSFKNWRKVTTFELDLKYTKTKSRAKFQLNMWKHVGEKCGKWADGDPGGRTESRTDGRRVGRTLPYHNTSRLKTGV